MSKKKVFLSILVILSPVILVLAFRLLILVVHFTSTTFFPDPQWNSWKTTTSPLTPDQVGVLCKKFDLGREAICSKQNVYGPEFYPYIIDAFHPTEFAKFGDSSKPADYEEVEKKLGQFKIKCYPGVTGSGTFQLFVCEYDLRGDGVYKLKIFFEEPDRTVFRIVGPLNDDWQ